MTLIESWKDSLRVLTPQGLKELGIATWETIKEIFRSLGKLWFLLVSICFIAVAVLVATPYRAGRYYGGFLMISALLAALPIARTKDAKYFFDYWMKYCWGMLKLLMLEVIIALLISGTVAITAYILKKATLTDVAINIFAIIGMATFGLLVTFTTILQTLILFFYLRQPTTIRSAIKKSAVCVWHNVPLLIICVLLLIGFFLLPRSVGLPKLVWVVPAFLLFCLGITLLIKRINADPALYQ